MVRVRLDRDVVGRGPDQSNRVRGRRLSSRHVPCVRTPCLVRARLVAEYGSPRGRTYRQRAWRVMQQRRASGDESIHNGRMLRRAHDRERWRVLPPRVRLRWLQVAHPHAHAKHAPHSECNHGSVDKAQPRRVEQRTKAWAAVDIVARPQRVRCSLLGRTRPVPRREGVGKQRREGVAVRHDEPLILPRVTQHVREERPMRDARDAIEGADGRHDAHERALTHQPAPRRQVRQLQVLLVDSRVESEPRTFRPRIRGEVAHDGKELEHAWRLAARRRREAHKPLVESDRELAREGWALAVRLRHAAPTRIPRDVDHRRRAGAVLDRSIRNVSLERARLVGDGDCSLEDELCVKGSREACSLREDGRVWPIEDAGRFSARAAVEVAPVRCATVDAALAQV